MSENNDIYSDKEIENIQINQFKRFINGYLWGIYFGVLMTLVISLL